MDCCNETQEKIAAGRALSGEEQRHAAACPACAAVAASYSLLDAALETFAPVVPDGFADRVMGLIAAQAAPGQPARWFERPPIQMAVAYAAGLAPSSTWPGSWRASSSPTSRWGGRHDRGDDERPTR